MQNKTSIRILIIDDEAEFAETLCTRLKLRDYDSQTATSGYEGLEILEKTAFDVVILDLRMPDINGLDILTIIKEKYSNTEVIILTGHASFKTGQRGMQEGAFDYLTKPVDLNVLLEKIHDACHGS